MKTQINHVLRYFKRVYLLSLSADNQDKTAWRQLKKLHVDAGWKSGIYESEKQIVAVFEIGNEKSAKFGYYIENREYHCKVNIVENYLPEMTTDLFILAAHFNNLLNKGKVEIDVDERIVSYNYRCDLLVPLLYSGEFYDRMLIHHSTSKDIYWAFEKLIHENEEPAVIISDLLNKNKEEKNDK
ncbi:MAG: hypothetical protein AUK44_00510 [Porphyromonadaceae bacterium CG2_30_38_12]|nr:MAG: hypothetical protein AUK44_00510 [Porphyromonadaceae bacterium CG2_30_38_12]